VKKRSTSGKIVLLKTLSNEVQMNKNKGNTKPANVDYFRVPRPLWRRIKRHLPKQAKQRGVGRPRVDNRAVINGIWYVLWTGCQWKAVHRDWFGVSSSVLHERFQSWQRQGIWDKIFQTMVRFYARERRVSWKWQAIDSKSVPSPLGGEATGPNPTDRGKRGAKIHLLVDERGAPLAVHITGANQHDKWSVDDLIVSIVVTRPGGEQHLCLDKGYDFEDVHQIVTDANYHKHIAHRRRRGEPLPQPIPEDQKQPARRWVVERTLGWLAKRRSIRTRWCKKAENWLAFVQFACAHILCDLAIFG
jgi:putative transposase